MELKIVLSKKFKLGAEWQRKRKVIRLGWITVQIKLGQYIPLEYASRGIYKYR